VVDLLLVVGIVLGVNLLPAFAPPTWAVLVVLRITRDVPAVPLVVAGALAATTGRVLLALAARRLRERLPARRRESLQALADAAQEHRGASAGLLGLFLLSPLPSGQLWTAAGLSGMPLRRLAIAFLVGRLVSYSIYVAVASAAEHSLRGVLGDAFASWWGIALQVVLLAGLVALVQIDWAKVVSRRRSEGP
jgi:uncharacterized membrane protein YdjX (TVP38/TMEM64 family)